MRQGYSQKILTVDGKFIGVSLGSDCCTEHEWGIKGIDRTFGLSDKKSKIGVARYQTQIPNQERNLVGFYEGEDYFGFYCISKPWNGADVSDPKNWGTKPYFYGDQDIYSAWDENNFCFFVKVRGGSKNKNQQRKEKSFNEATKNNLKRLFDALMEGKAVVWIGGAGVFSNGGLCFALADQLPQSVIDTWVESHTEQKEMDEYLKKTGIHDILEKAGKKFFYCGPSRLKDGIKFWLNPYDQKKYNHGWYTLEELKEWCQDKGPVVNGRSNGSKR